MIHDPVEWGKSESGRFIGWLVAAATAIIGGIVRGVAWVAGRAIKNHENKWVSWRTEVDARLAAIETKTSRHDRKLDLVEKQGGHDLNLHD